MNPEEQAERALGEYFDPEDAPALIRTVASAIRAAVAQNERAWRRTFMAATTHSVDCPILPLARQGRCTCGAHDRLAEAHRRLAAQIRSSG